MRILMLTADHEMIDRRILQEARSLIAAGHEIKLLAGFECANAEEFSQDGIEIGRYCYDWSDSRVDRLAGRLGLNRGSRVYPWLLRSGRSLAERLPVLTSFEQFVFDRTMEQRFDLLHIHDYPMLRPGVAAAQARRVPVVYDTHEFYPHQVQFPDVLRHKMLALERKAIRHADAVITVNEFIGREIAREYGIAEPTIIHNAVPLEEITVQATLRADLGLPADAQLILYQGWLSPERGIDTLIQMMSHLDRGHLVIVGYGAYLESLRELTRTLGLEARVHFMGRKESDELQQITAACDLGVIPYHGIDLNNHFCSPNKLFEFVMARLPFVCNALPYLESVVQAHGCGTTADLRDPVAAARVVSRLLGDSTELEALRRGCERARSQLNWETEERVLLDLYQKLPAVAGPPAAVNP